MKKQWFICLGCFLLAALLCLAVSWPRDSSGTGLPVIIPTRPTKPTQTTQPSSTEPEAPGQVRLYACGREEVAVYEALALQFTEQTGVECEILTGELSALMESDTAPTVFCVHSREEAAAWAGNMLDLTDSAVLSQLYSGSFALEMGGKPVGLAMDLEGYGLIFNAALLAQAGYTRTDLTDLASLQAAVAHITSDRNVLGFRAFGAVETGAGFAAFLSNAGRSSDQIRQLLDLQIENSKTSGDPMKQFVAGQTVFYMGGISDYGAVADMGIHNLDILPLFTEDGGTIHCLCDTYWCVNALSSAADTQVSLDFLQWLVTAGESGAAPVDTLGWLSPFADANWAENAFERALRNHIAQEPVRLYWRFDEGGTPLQWTQLSDAISAYAAKPSDETWAAVEALLKAVS